MPELPDALLHPTVRTAAQGRFPDWTVAKGRRLKHMARVANLLRSWAEEREERLEEVLRWTAAGYLHDTFRDADPEELRRMVDPPFRDLPEQVLHGPATARKLREEGVEDEGLLHAITYHTLGSPDFDSVGMALFAADFLEPGRNFLNAWREDLRDRFPEEPEEVVRKILKARLLHRIDEERPLRSETVAFWNRMTEGAGWASVSES